MQGKYDDLPEMAFYMVGDITEVQEKADKMAKEIAARKVGIKSLHNVTCLVSVVRITVTTNCAL